MATDYRFDPDQKLVVTCYWGRVQAADVATVRRARERDDGLAGVGAHLVVATGIEHLDLSAPETREAAGYVATGTDETSRVRTAIVARSDIVFGMSRMFGMRVDVLRDGEQVASFAPGRRPPAGCASTFGAPGRSPTRCTPAPACRSASPTGPPAEPARAGVARAAGRSQQRAAQDDARDREVDDDAGHVHERRDERRRGARGISPTRRSRNGSMDPESVPQVTTPITLSPMVKPITR